MFFSTIGGRILATAKSKRKIIALLVAAAMVFTCFSFIEGTASAATGKKMPYEKGQNIKNAVFYIAVDAEGDGNITGNNDAVYYYTYSEIKNTGDEVAYHYGNHGQGETANVKGAKVSTLLEGLQLKDGVSIGDDWVIQYMEEDAYHGNPAAGYASYRDTVAGLTDPEGNGNGSGAGVPAESIVGYSLKTIYDNPDANNVNDKDYVSFLDFEREASHVRAYRQTTSANSSVMKMLKGITVTNPEGGVLQDPDPGYTLVSVDSDGNKIADDYVVEGLLTGMVWPATPNVDVPWADLSTSQSGNWNGASKIITIGEDYNQEVSFKFVEKPFFEAYGSDSETVLKRSNIAQMAYEYPTSNVIDGTKYEFFGFNKPMYVRYYGVKLTEVLDDTQDNEKVYILDENGKRIDITERVDDFFVAQYYTQSKSSSNISNRKRTPLDYGYSVLVDTASADIEYSNDSSDYTPISGKGAVEYKNANILILKQNEAVTGVKVQLKAYNSAQVSWDAAEDAAGYRVSYRTGSGKWLTKETAKNSIVLAKLNSNKKYEIKVCAFDNAAGEKEYGKESKAVKVTTLAAPVLTVKKSGKKAVVSYKNLAGETGYQIYQKTGKGKWKLAKKLAANKIKWTSKVLKKGKTSFKVRAFAKAGTKTVYSPWSKVKTVTIK